MLLTGTFARAIDEKQRVAIPKSLRDAMGTAGSTILFVTPNTDSSLALYTEARLAQLAERLTAASPNGQDVRAFGRLFYAEAQAMEVDRQGRIRIPPELAKLAGLSKEVVLLGVQDHLEVWDRGRWEAYVGDKQDRFDEIAESAFDQRSNQ